MARKKVKKRNSTSELLYSVVKFIENRTKMFECIWDGWFVDENRDHCRWPPNKGKSYLLRVLSKEKPDDSWKIYQCEVISEGHVTYSSGFDYVKEKCAQKFNTSSADEGQAALRYKRMHPVLASTEAESIEHLFKKGKADIKRKLEAEIVQKEQDGSVVNLSVKRSKSEKRGKSLTSATITSKDVNRADEMLSNHHNSEPTCSRQSQVLSRRSRSRSNSVEKSNVNSGNPCSEPISTNSKNTNQPIVNVSPHCSTKISTSPFSNRSFQSKSRSRSRSSSQHSLSNTTRSSRSNSSRKPCWKSPRRSRSKSPRRSRSKSPRRSHSKSPERSLSNSSCRSRSNSRSSSRSNARQRSTSPTFGAASSAHSKSRSASNSGTSFQSNTPAHRSSSPTSENQFVTKASSTSSSLHFMQLQLKELRAIVKQNHYRIAVNDRRQARMEVSVNKVLVTMTDLKNAINSNNVSTSGTPPVAKSKEIPKGFKTPDFPLEAMPQLVTLNRNLTDGEFRVFLLTQEKYYCSASRQSDAVVMTAYLKRFISLKLRDELHLKDAKGTDEPTLVRDFPQIYKFLIDVMINGYQESNIQLKPSDAHLALRTVWGRTKQMLREQRT